MIKFKIGDTVKVTLGKDKGRGGKIVKIYAGKFSALVEGVNLYKKHIKSRSEQKGGIFELPRPLLFSKIALVCPSCKKETRVGVKIVGNEKVRFCKKCKKEINISKK